MPADSRPRSFPAMAKHPGQTKQYAFQDIGREEYVLKTDLVLVKAFEIGFVKEMFKPRRLITKQNAWLELRKSLQLHDVVQHLKSGIGTALEHLRTLDVDRRRMLDRVHESLEESYGIWIWAVGG